MTGVLQYISQGDSFDDHISNIEKVCSSGCTWIQLRLKNCTDEEYQQVGREARKITKSFKAKLIINDNLFVAQKINADGVHLGLSDVNTSEARKSSSKDFIIGGTANTLDDVLMHYENGVNYVGFGPLKYTRTKKNLSPIIGLEGYSKLNQELLGVDVTIPIVAIGGIEMADFKPIKEAGVNNIAVSGLLTTGDASEVVRKFNKIFNNG